ncbi:hypothetical protein PHYSODRAFT_341000 [Phytophthora sojae]|uniref:Uncharacterized protein n=1 Tax=Phytophthora sojae (strain P6497) TaxID=1094619 RepID=G5ABU4_PHYSP|nr:hypothetical protein PHYSODRAFT_341000 [Phytophthora sojae]EGZ06819.1 hypothetical protein PHYSODRAFT_341000 [Phytophthora sojae]|eukprot:XP_009537583.1 hypothetical protein PHYSODRAFT_341000 [Phytophthora sojae]
MSGVAHSVGTVAQLYGLGVMVARASKQATVTSSSKSRCVRKAPSNLRPAKRPMKSTESAPKSSRSAAKAPKKKTKKQLNEEAMQRRRELAAFDKVWATTTAPSRHRQRQRLSMLLQVPLQKLTKPPATQTWMNYNADTDATAHTIADANATTVAANADKEASPASNADANGTTVAANADMKVGSIPSTATNADAEGLHDESAGNLSDASEGEVTADPQDEAYDPDEDDDDDAGNSASRASDGETKDADAHVVCDDTTRRVLRDQSGTAPLRFDYTDVLDPNLVEPSGDNALDSDGEGDEDSAEASSDVSDVASGDTSDPCKTDCLQREVSRLKALMSSEELERLHMTIQESSEVYNDAQLDAMKLSAWEALEDNIIPDITDDPIVDKMYDGYCGPSRNITEASKSPLKLFYYLLPKTLWRKVAAQTNLYWRQTFEARLRKAEEKEQLVTNRR